jgi:hypothetical protein
MLVTERPGRVDLLTPVEIPELNHLLRDPVFVELARDALGPGWSESLRADMVDFAAFVRRVAIWARLHSLMHGDYWESTPFREWRGNIGVELVARLHASERWTVYKAVRSLLVWAGFFGPRVSLLRRRRLLRVAEVLGGQFMMAMHNHRYLTAHLTHEDGGESNPDAFAEAYGFFAWDYMTLHEMLLEVTAGLDFVDVDLPEIYQFEHGLAVTKVREWQPWLRMHDREAEIRGRKA